MTYDMTSVTIDSAQLIRSIEQQLENIQSFDEDLAWQYECELYYDHNDDEEPQPIVELFTPELLENLTQIAMNGHDQTPVTMEFSFEEHALLNDMLLHASEAMDFSIPSIYELPEDSEIRQRYETVERLRQFSFALWAKRFGN